MNAPQPNAHLPSVDLSVVIPFLDEAANLAELVVKLDEFFGAWPEIRAEVIFVDDGSTDDSCARLVAWSPLSAQARLLRLSQNFGGQAAARAGFLEAAGELCVNFCADLQDPVELLRMLYDKAHEGYDVVYGLRRTVQRGWREALFSRIHAWLLRKTAFPNFPEKGLDIVLFSRKVRAELNAHVESDAPFQLQIMALGLRSADVAFDRRARHSGRSKWTLARKLKLFADSFIGFSQLPIRIPSVTGITLIFAGLLWGLYAVVQGMLHDGLPSNVHMLTAVILVGFGVTNVSLGILGEYASRALSAARSRKPFIVDEVISLRR
jgi:glycosyltransferase involved in cell wall biosynthesis